MNVMSGVHRKLNPDDGRSIVNYINKRIEEKAEMERRGIPFFKADTEPFESQDIKRLTMLDKIFKKRVTPFKHKRLKEFKITKAQKPFWHEFMNMNKEVDKKERITIKTSKDIQSNSLKVPSTLGWQQTSPSLVPSPGSSLKTSEPSPGPSFASSHGASPEASPIGPSQMTDYDEDEDDLFNWKYYGTYF